MYKSMDKIEIAISVLTGIALIGVITLLGIGKDIDAVLPILTALIGALLGAKKEMIAGIFSKK